jgi:hypothetical protein
MFVLYFDESVCASFALSLVTVIFRHDIATFTCLTSLLSSRTAFVNRHWFAPNECVSLPNLLLAHVAAGQRRHSAFLHAVVA